ncbi:MAG TPA: pitrilysin family protein [Planctomycetota bacterium]|nr:pitrilysin family protein [Planctomycetota bacterium]
MNIRLPSILMLAAVAACSPSPISAAPAPDPQDTGFKLPVQELVLDNGLRVLIVERHDVPRVFCSLWWRVGSVNEHTGGTGLSHFFEHMMFMGTDVIGTRDAKKDAELNAKIEDVMGRIRKVKLARLEAKRRGLEPVPGKDVLSLPEKALRDALPKDAYEDEYRSLMKEYEGYVEEQKKIIIPEHLSKIFQANGGTGLNATTSYDRTNYFVELPSNKVELFCWLESDRFLKPVFRSFYPERDVVKEERRMRTDSTPTGLVHEDYWAMLWEAHPYHWPVLGWMSDIDEYRLADAQRYYDTHYSPQNCTAIFVGDVVPGDIKELAKRYFGRLRRFSGEREAIVTQEPDQVAERRIEAEAEAKDDIAIEWHGPAAVHKDSAACDLLMSVFAGRSGRLYRPLVEEKQLALEIESYFYSLRYGGVLHLGAEPRAGADPVQVEKAITAIVEDVRAHGITDRELEKVRNQQMADLVRGLKTNTGIAQQLGYFETVGTYQDFFGYAKALESVTAADLQRCAEHYLKPAGRNVLVIRRKEKK